MTPLKQNQSHPIHSAMAGLNTPYVNENFSRYIARLGITPKDVCRLCERSPRTVRNWMVNNPPGWVYILLKPEA